MGKGKGEGKGKSTNVASEKYEKRNLPTIEKMNPDPQEDDYEKMLPIKHLSKLIQNYPSQFGSQLMG